MKATAKAPSNIALIKYWGKKKTTNDPDGTKFKLPENGSISFCTSDMYTLTTVELDEGLESDTFELGGKVLEGKKADKVSKHVDLFRKLSGNDSRVRVKSNNNFPADAGLSSSASAFAALTVSSAAAFGLELSEKELAIMSRQGSGSSCRSIPGGFVEWYDAEDSEGSYAETIYNKDYWDIYDVVAVVSEDAKEVSSTEGQKSAGTSSIYADRLVRIPAKIEEIKGYMESKDFTKFGQLVEQEAMELHAVMMTSIPPIYYLRNESLSLMKMINKWRQEGFESYGTINTGQNVHIIVEGQNKDELVAKLEALDWVQDIIVNKPADGTQLVDEHLF